jgi:hypothetical protein
MALSAALRRRTSAGGRAGRRTRPNLRADLSGVRCARSRSARSRDRSVPLASRAAVASSANALAFDPETRAGVRSAACPPGRAATSMLTIDRFPLAGVCTATGGSFVRQSNGADCLASAGLRSRTVTRRYIPPRKAGTNVAWAPEKSLLRRECPRFRGHVVKPGAVQPQSSASTPVVSSGTASRRTEVGQVSRKPRIARKPTPKPGTGQAAHDVRSAFPSVRSIRLARWSTGPRCGLTDEFPRRVGLYADYRLMGG